MKINIFFKSFLLLLIVGNLFSCTQESSSSNNKVSVTGIALDKSSLNLKVDEKEPLKATIAPYNATNKGLTWVSSKASVATVSISGEVTAVEVGTTTITVTTADGSKTATAEVTVTEKVIAVTNVSLDKPSLSLKIDGKEPLKATIVPSNATNKGLTWVSSKASVATVSTSGEVTAVEVGTATITVTTADGSKIATAEVTVNILPKVDALGTLIYGISQNTSKDLPLKADIDRIAVAKIIFKGLNSSSSATIEIRYVKTDGVDTNDGMSWTTAKRGIKATLDAITDATANKIYLLLIGSGIYTPAATLSMKNHVAIIGGFKASSNTEPSYYSMEEVTVISGDETRQVFSNRGLNVNGVPSSAVLARVTVTKGKAKIGGGMFNNSSSPIVTEVTFSSNSSAGVGGGGGMFNYKSSPIVTKVTFSSNSSDYVGGGMYNSTNSSPIVTEVTFSSNFSKSIGGGMYNEHSSPILNRVTFSNNSATNTAGGMYSESGLPILTGVTFFRNTAKYGGGMVNSNSSPIISSTIFWDNTTTRKITNTLSQIDNSNSFPVIAHSIIQEATEDSSKGIINTNPNLVTLANNSGFVQTIAIGGNSSAKDKGLYFARGSNNTHYYSANHTNWYTTPLLTGTPTALPSTAIEYTTDARGYSNDNRPDIGAYEYNGTAP